MDINQASQYSFPPLGGEGLERGVLKPLVAFLFASSLFLASIGNAFATTTFIPLSQQPLLTATQAAPNLLFMIDDSGSMSTIVPNSGNLTRLQVAQQTVNDLLNSLTGVRVGLATFNGTNAQIKVGINNISTNLSTMISAVNSLQATENTPLANTQLEMGRYFVQGFNNTLTLHPGDSNQSTNSAYNIFNNTPLYSNNVTTTSPIQYFCQKSFVILLTDGEPYADVQPAASTGLTNYVYTAATCPINPNSDPDLPNNTSLTCALANIAAAMYDMDLRPDLTDPTGNAKKNNVETYTIGFGGVTPAGNALLAATAQNAGGAFLEAADTTTLVQAFQNATSSILNQTVSAPNTSFNSQNLTVSSAIYEAQYNTTHWSGSLFKFPVSITGTIGAAQWDAGALLTAIPYQNRLVFTYNNDSAIDRPILFTTLSSLAAAQQSDLSRSATTGAADTNGQLRLNYLLGDRTQEQTSTNTTNLFRQRSSVLGDIVNSTPIFVGGAVSNWPDIAPFPTAANQTYSSFKAGIPSTRTPTVYVGADDGMLHGFNANTGQEVMAYVPLSLSNDFNTSLQTRQGLTLSNSAAITLGLHYYTNPVYAHRFYVD
ncbi:MAG: VWA domain-containing protein, partial [Gammaproteobacteria bacterium]|nr:VWA domain-containing protein [Gammaproteobacteria bacterium]